MQPAECRCLLKTRGDFSLWTIHGKLPYILQWVQFIVAPVSPMTRLILTTLLLLASTAWAGPFEDAIAASNRKDYATALRLFRPMAEQGYSDAQSNLGLMYEEGKGVVPVSYTHLTLPTSDLV